ncbi:hypothetical protein GY45DRAFT_1327967 [Cubamyces sp. BRFM 1775]|nr:hypothetical protein GY45DRAFT_1327967 [Cubamyces sp. BRFM 1775]
MAIVVALFLASMCVIIRVRVLLTLHPLQYTSLPPTHPHRSEPLPTPPFTRFCLSSHRTKMGLTCVSPARAL